MQVTALGAARRKAGTSPLTAEQKILLFRNLMLAMTLDRLMMRIIRAGRMVGFYHEGGIALAPGIAAGTFLRKDDVLWPHYRAHGLAHMLAKGIDVEIYIAEHMGREAGCCKGRSSFHFSFPQDHVFGLSGNIGANFPMVVGYGLAAKYKKTDQVVMNCSGDGSYGEGRSHEALLISSLWKLPVIFWLENNGMAQHSGEQDLFPGKEISALAAGYGMPAMKVDGQDLFACAEAALEAIAHTRAGKGPIFVECRTLRAQEHSVGNINNEGPVKRDQKLMEEWKTTRDPLKIAAARLIEEGLATDKQIAEWQAEADKQADAMDAFSEASPKAAPSIEELYTQVYAGTGN